MKALFICMDHYPKDGACTSLLNKMLFTGGLAGRLGDVHVLTIKKEDQEAECECFQQITVHRCGVPMLLTKEEILSFLKRKPFCALQYMIIKAKARIKKKMCVHKPFLEESSVATLMKKMCELETENFDVVIPICGHYETAVVAMESKCPVVIYQVDPCATNMRFAQTDNREVVQFEQKLYETAAAIITTPILYREICETYPSRIAEKAYAMEFPNVDVESVPNRTQERKEIRCLFAGMIYPIARNPRYTVELFHGIHNSRIRLVFAGADKNQVCRFVDEKLIGENMSFLGVLPLEQARVEIANADILVNIGNIMTNQVPSKLFEYISSGKPILNICVNPNCPSIPYLEKYPLALSIVEGVGTPEEHSAQIEKFIIENAGRTVDKAILLERFKECTAEYCAKQMAHVLKKCKS